LWKLSEQFALYPGKPQYSLSLLAPHAALKTFNIFATENGTDYKQPEDIHTIYKKLSAISPNFSIAAGFGNVHGMNLIRLKTIAAPHNDIFPGVYKPGNVKLHPELLSKHQKYVKDKEGLKDDKPVFLVFHGGSGSSKDEFKQAISYGVVKVVCGFPPVDRGMG